MRHRFEEFDDTAREAFAVLLAAAQGDLYSIHRSDRALVQALPVFEDLLDGPQAAAPPEDHFDEVFDQLRLHVLYEELQRRWHVSRSELEDLSQRGALRERLEAGLSPASAAG